MLDMHTLFEANDQIAVLTAITMSESTGKRLELYAGLAKENDVRRFFNEQVALMKKTSDDLRKHLDRLGGA